jgi:hypothetical protein
MIEHLTTTYAGEDASLEILIMLSVAFFLGFIFRYSIGQVRMAKMNSEIDKLKRSEYDMIRIKEALSHKLAYFQDLKKEEVVLKEPSFEEREEQYVLERLHGNG